MRAPSRCTPMRNENWYNREESYYKFIEHYKYINPEYEIVVTQIKKSLQFIKKNIWKSINSLSVKCHEWFQKMLIVTVFLKDNASHIEDRKSPTTAWNKNSTQSDQIRNIFHSTANNR
jgi:hypothetical protein